MAQVDEIYDEANRLKSGGQLDQAVAKLLEGLQLDPSHVLSHAALAVNYQRLGQKEKAIEHATKVTQLEPHDPWSFTQLSVICQRCGKIPEAEAAMAQAHALQGHGHRH